MRVLFLMFAFPDMNKSFNMYTTMVDYFHRNGHLVRVLAPGHGEKSQLKIEKDIEVLRVKTLPIKNVGVLWKGIANILLPYQYKKQLDTFYPGEMFDCIVIPTPPITLGRLAASLKRKYQAKTYLILRDIFPQNAADLGFMKPNSILFRYFRNQEKALYQKVDFIGCMSKGNILYVKKHNPSVDHAKLHLLRNWQYLYTRVEIDKSELSRKYNLQEKFVVVFGGNMGKPQQLSNVLKLAESALELKDVIFLLLGEGVRMNSLRKEIEKRQITNIEIHGTVPKQEYQDLISICDLGLISLHKDFTIPNIPSKSLDYFNVGLPVLASIDRSTDFNEILDKNGLGLWSYAGDHDLFYGNLKQLYSDRVLRNKISQNVREYFIKHLQPEIAYKTVIQALSEG